MCLRSSSRSVFLFSHDLVGNLHPLFRSCSSDRISRLPTAVRPHHHGRVSSLFRRRPRPFLGQFSVFGSPYWRSDRNAKRSSRRRFFRLPTRKPPKSITAHARPERSTITSNVLHDLRRRARTIASEHAVRFLGAMMVTEAARGLFGRSRRAACWLVFRIRATVATPSGEVPNK